MTFRRLGSVLIQSDATGVMGEKTVVIANLNERFDGTSPVILGCHGMGGSALSWLPTAFPGSDYAMCASLAEAGFLVVCSDFGGDAAWGNAACRAKMLLACNTYSPGRSVGLIGGSMGGANSCAFIVDEPDKVNAFMGIVPAVNMDDMYAQPFFQPSMDAAWGGDYQTNGFSFSGHINTTEIATALGDDGCLIYASSIDEAVPYAGVQDFAADLTPAVCTLIDLEPGVGGWVGHSVWYGEKANEHDVIAFFNNKKDV